jgi:hypothetical protein
MYCHDRLRVGGSKGQTKGVATASSAPVVCDSASREVQRLLVRGDCALWIHSGCDLEGE